MERAQPAVLRANIALALVLVFSISIPTPRVLTHAQGAQDAQIQWYLTLPPDQPGFPLPLEGAYLESGSSPVLVDLNGDGDLEIVIAGRDLSGGSPGSSGRVYAYRHDGSPLWIVHVRAPVNSTPTTADLTGDGHPDVVVGLGGYAEAAHWHGGVVALNGLNGQELWTFDTQDWLNHRPDGWRDGVFSTPAIGDVNSDGQPEIAFGAWDQCTYLLDRNGQPLWGNLPGILPETYCGGHGFYNEDTFWSSPALADMDGDGEPEIVIGADISPGNVWGDRAGGYLYILDGDGQVLAREWMDQVVYSSPAVADLDADGRLEIVVGTGLYWSRKGYYVSSFQYDPAPPDPADRLVLKWRRSTLGRVFASPAIADLNQDGWLDVVITVAIGESGEGGSTVYAWRGSDGAQLFQRQACDFMGHSGSTISSPVVADVNGDGWSEILFSQLWEVAILNHDGTYYTDYSNPKCTWCGQQPACARDHTPTTELTYWARYSLHATPAYGDLDGDGQFEIVIGGHNADNPNQGMLFAWTGLSAAAQPAWPTWRHDPNHTGNLHFELSLPVNPTSLSSPSHPLGAWSTSNLVAAVWSGASDPDSGVGGYSIAWDASPGSLPDSIRDLAADAGGVTSPPQPDGASLYFHLRTTDQAGNWAPDAIHLGPFWIDANPPSSRAASPDIATGPFEVTWNGSDSTSGVASFTIEVRDSDGPWSVWLDGEDDTSAPFQGAIGHTYHFRSIARDEAGNVEPAGTPQGDSTTVVAEAIVSGAVHDLQGEPVAGAQVSSQPQALNQPSTTADGHYALALPATGDYDLTTGRPRYGALPPMQDVTVDGDRGGVDFYLPPVPNLVQDGGFEQTLGWELSGVVAPFAMWGVGHTGDRGLQMGDLPPGGMPESAQPWTWLAEQTVDLPSDHWRLDLSWLYRVEGTAAPGDELVVSITGTTQTISRTLPWDAESWTHSSIDVSGLAGQQVALRFSLVRQPTDTPLLIWLDEVSLGPPALHLAFCPLILRDR